MNSLTSRRMSGFIVAWALCQTVAETQPVAYPAKGQSAEQQQQDQAGAAVGAAAGTMAGGSRARQNRRNAQASTQAQSQNAMGTCNQAYSACMSGRGYSMHWVLVW